MAVPLPALPFIAAAGASALAAGVVLVASFNKPSNRALALFLVVFGALNASIAQFFAAPTTEQQAFWYRLAWYFGLADAPLLLWLVATHPEPRSALPRWMRRGTPFLVLAGLIAAAYILWRPLFFQYAGPSAGTTPIAYLAGVRPGPLLVIDRFLDLIFPLAALVFAHDAFRHRGATARSTLVLAVGLPLLFLYRSMTELAALVTAPSRPALDLAGAAALAAQILQLFLVVALVGYLVVRGRQADDALRVQRRNHLFVLAGVALVGLLTGATGHTLFTTPLAVLLEGTAFLLGPLLITYGLLTRQLVDIDLVAKRSVHFASFIGVFVAGYALAVMLARPFMEPSARPLAGLAVVLLLVLALGPIQRFAAHLAEAMVPGAHASPSYLNLRRLEIYRAEVEARLGPDGSLTNDATAALQALRRDLRVTERDHIILLLALRGVRSASGAAGVTAGDVLLGNYRIRGLLGTGAAGRTFLAERLTDGHQVAIKVFRRGTDVAHEALREAGLAATVQHPNVVAVHGVETFGDEAALIMDHCAGGSLAEKIRHGALPSADFPSLARGLLAALAALHDAGILHRDVKPGNVFLTAAGGPKLGDFGIAGAADLDLTREDVGVPIGTLAYASPEQARGHRYTVQSDLYSAAATLYEAYTGTPYQQAAGRETAWDLQVRIASGTRSPIASTVPPKLNAWFRKALDPQPHRRFKSAEEMLRALETAVPWTEAPILRQNIAGTDPRPERGRGEAAAGNPAAPRPS